MNYTDTELLGLAKEFDQTALATIYDRYSTALYRYAYHQTGDQHTAEDCVAETFSRFLKALHQRRGPRDHLKAYLYRIAHNWITDLYRKQSGKNEPLEAAETLQFSTQGTVESTVIKEITGHRLREYVSRLKGEQQQVIILKHLEGLDNSEVAEILGKNVGSIKALNSRALENLRKHMQDDEFFGNENDER